MKRWQRALAAVGGVAGVVVVVAAVMTLASGSQARFAPQAADEREAGLMVAAAPVVPPSYASRKVERAQEAAPADASGAPVSLALPTSRDLAAEQAADTLRMLIRTGSITMQVPSLEPAVAEVRVIAAGAGGYVASSSQTTNQRVRSAIVEVKVPAQRFDRLFEGLRAVGRVEVANVAAEDVGEEYTDVAARMANARRLEERLLQLLATRTGRLQDVLEVERELARVREEIERYAGRLQYLRAHAAVSTITVLLHEPGTVIGGRPGGNVLGQAFLQAWRNILWVVAFVIQALGAILPLALLALGGWALWRWKRGKRPAA